MSVIQKRKQEREQAQMKIAKLEEKRRSIFEKVKNQEKLNDNNGYKIFRADLGRSLVLFQSFKLDKGREGRNN